MDIGSRVKLSNGVEMPWLGFGCYQLPPGADTRRAVLWALEAGYRAIDTASLYANERDVGAAIAESGIPRDELFVITKAWSSELGYRETKEACQRSLERLWLGAIDLYLIHWPVEGRYVDAWRAMHDLYAEKVVRAVGVSNFLEHHIDRIIAETGLRPTVNQVEFHPQLQQPALLAYGRQADIRHQAWSPLSRGQALDIAPLVEIAAAHGKSTAQIILRWDLQLGVATIPKSVHRSRIIENSRLFDFELSPYEMATIAKLDCDGRVGAHPDDPPLFEIPTSI